MKAIRLITLVVIAALGAAAQMPGAAKKPAAPASQTPASGTAAKTAPAKAPAKTAAAKPAAAKPELAKTQIAPDRKTAGKRDPFVSPVMARVRGGAVSSCATGKRCLVIDQISLQGVVKTQSGWIAVLTNPAKKTYYLREKDAVFNGYLMKITGDSVVFQENVIDALGKQSTREVVKRLNTPAV